MTLTPRGFGAKPFSGYHPAASAPKDELSQLTEELSGKIAVVTGGASGIGAAIVQRFVASGAKVVFGDILDEVGQRLADRLGAAAVFRHADVADSGQLAELVTSAVDTFGRLDVMVNNAAVSGTFHPWFFDDDFADFDKIVAVNMLAVMRGTQLAGRQMATMGGGSIINLSSIGGIQAGAAVMTYRATKAAVVHFTKCAAIDMSSFGIRVNCLAPGSIPTPLLSSAAAVMGAERAAKFEAVIRQQMREDRPLPRDGAPEDAAEAALYLACDRSRYMTGTVITVDGGTIAGRLPRGRRSRSAASADATAAAK